MAYFDGKHYVVEDLLPRLFGGGAHYVHIDMLRGILDAEGFRYEPATLRRYLHQWTGEGCIHDAGRGWYSDLSEPVVFDAGAVEPVIGVLEKGFPFLDFAVWSTRQLAPWFHHQLNRHLVFAKVEREALGAAGETLEAAGYEVKVHPLGEEAKRFSPRSPETVVLRPLLADDAPRNDHTLPPEQVLVALRVEIERLGFLETGEFGRLLGSLATQFRVGVGPMLHYAKRRKIKESELLETLPVNDPHFFEKNADR